MPAFNEARDKTVDASSAISGQRGGTYQDSWALENMSPKHLDAVIRDLLGLDDTKVDKRIKRILMVAALCDVKNSRWTGGFQYDTVVDTINYEAALGSWWKEYLDAGRTTMALPVLDRDGEAYESPHRAHCAECGLPLAQGSVRYLANNGQQYHFEHRPAASKVTEPVKAKVRPANHADHLPQ